MNQNFNFLGIGIGPPLGDLAMKIPRISVQLEAEDEDNDEPKIPFDRLRQPSIWSISPSIAWNYHNC